VYFFILKLEVKTSLLEPALCGMSKFAHLVNVELVLDLIAAVSEKLEKEGTKLSTPCKLHCIATTFKVLMGRGTAIEMDVRQHYVTMYAMLLDTAMNRYEWNHFGVLFDCMNSMFGRHASKSLPVDRVASFVKRLVHISLQLPQHIAIGCLHQARKLIRSDPRLYNMLSWEGGYDREYLPDEKSPDHANSLSCCLWELTLSSMHFHPFAAQYSRDLAAWNEIELKLSMSMPDKVAYKYDVSTTGCFKPFVKQSKAKVFSMSKHPTQSLDNAQSVRRMVSWFEGGGEGKDKLEEAVVNGNQMADAAIARFTKNGALIAKNDILKELNREYKLLSSCLQND